MRAHVLPDRGEESVGFILVVRATSQRDVLDGRRTAGDVRRDVVELEEAAGRAAPPSVPHVTALALVAHPDRALHVRGDVTGRDAHAARPPGALGRGRLLLREVRDE